MDVDARERRAGGGGRGGDAPRRRNPGSGAADRRRVVNKPAERKIPDRPICSHEARAEPRALERPWPQQHEWRNLVRRLAKNPVGS
jgi:hypothetical protein